MAETTLQDQLTALGREHAIRLENLEGELKVAQVEHARVQVELDQMSNGLEPLRERLAGLTRDSRRLQGELRDRARLQARQEFQAVRAGLDQSQAGILRDRDYWSAWARLNEQLRALMQADSGLDKALQDYQSFEMSRSSIQNLPPLHQKTLLETQEKLRQRVTPFLKLREEEKAVQRNQPSSIQVVVARSPAQARINWVIPLPPDSESSSSDEDGVLSALVASLMNRLVAISKDPGWVFSRLTVGAWAGYAALLSFAQYDGEQNLADATQSSLQAGLKRAPLLGSEGLQVQVAEMTWAAWECGLELQEPEPASLVIQPVKPAVAAGPPLVARSEGWYSDDDVLAWNRPLQPVPGSLWNVQARRLRTLMIRIIAKGMIDTASIPVDALWKPLPPPGDQEMRAGIERLIEKSLLVEVETDAEAGRSVTLNRDLIGEAQNLINRNVTGFWADVIDSQAARPEG